MNVTVYIQQNCPACDQALADLQALQADFPHKLVLIPIDDDAALQERFAGRVPLVEVGPYKMSAPIEAPALRVMLGAAHDRVDQLTRIDQAGYEALVERGSRLSFGDKISLSLSRHYLLWLNVFLFIYVGLPFLAPVLMENNLTLPANIIYRGYSVMCHQLAFRSWFLYGEQAYYPRQLAEIPNVITFEQVQGNSKVDILAAREFEGNSVVGFKVALCERDVAIYGTMLLFGLIYGLTGRKIGKISWWWWVAIGLVPIGIDGVSQLPGLVDNLPAWLPIRESTPLLRTLTGGLFGWMTGWYLLPMMEETMQDTRVMLERKLAAIKQANARAGQG